MANTTNFGWETPDDTDLVKDGASAIRTLGSAIDTSLVDLKGGTTGQVLSKASNTDMDFTWVAQDDSNAIQNAIVDAKGDLISATAADTPARLPVGTEGQVLTVASAESTGLKWVTPTSGTKTVSILGNTTAASIYSLGWNGSNIYVAGFGNGSLYSSTDSGVTWTSRTSGFGGNGIYGITYGNGIFVAVGGNGIITTSTDGITWTARTAGVSTNSLYNVKYVNSVFIAVGTGANGGSGGITTSTDGITWTKRNTPTNSSTELYDIAYGNGYYVVVGDANVKNGYYSTNLSTWTANGTNATVEGRALAFNSGTFFCFPSGNVAGRYFTDPSATWTSISSSTVPVYAPVAAGMWGSYNGNIYYINSNVQDAVYGYTLTMAGTVLQARLTPIPLPIVAISGTNANGFDSYVRAFLMTSGGNFIYADDAGRIYKSS